jgi:hypothetical protein
MAFGKTIVETLKSAAKNPAVRKAAQEALATVVAAGAGLIAKQMENAGKTSPPDDSKEATNAQTLKKEVEEDPGMATLGEVEESIRRVERVVVSFVHRKSGRDVRDDRRGFTPYPFVNKAPEDLRVSDFIRRRLADYERHGLKAIVKYENNDHAHGGTRLSEVRETYDD